MNEEVSVLWHRQEGVFHVDAACLPLRRGELGNLAHFVERRVEHRYGCIAAGVNHACRRRKHKLEFMGPRASRVLASIAHGGQLLRKQVASAYPTVRKYMLDDIKESQPFTLYVNKSAALRIDLHQLLMQLLQISRREILCCCKMQ